MIKGNLDQSTHIGQQTNISGPVTFHQGRLPTTADELIRRGRELLHVRAYADAADSLRDALSREPANPRASLLLGLALLEGKNPELVRPGAIREAKSCLRIAAGDDRTCAASLTVLGVIKYDRYVRNGMDEGQPNLEEIARQLRSVELTDLDKQILGHLDATARAKRRLGVNW
jgi:hypothetical protein